jgi:translation elongation factor EF-Tu-like GTPase
MGGLMEKEVGKIIHYFDKIGVGIVELEDELKVGDKIHIVGSKTDFEQTVSSMQEEHKALEKAGKGKQVGIKVDKEVRENDKVYIITE